MRMYFLTWIIFALLIDNYVLPNISMDNILPNITYSEFFFWAFMLMPFIGVVIGWLQIRWINNRRVKPVLVDLREPIPNETPQTT